MAQLIVVEGPNRGRTYELAPDSSTIGRGPNNSIVLDDRRASEMQAEIRKRNNSYEIVNLDIKKNLLVNGEVFKKSKLQHGDWITLADTTARDPAGEPLFGRRADLAVMVAVVDQRQHRLE